MKIGSKAWPSSRTSFTAASMPRLKSIGFMPATTLRAHLWLVVQKIKDPKKIKGPKNNEEKRLASRSKT